MTKCLECAEEKTKGVNTMDGFVCDRCIDRIYMKDFVEELKPKLPPECKIINKPTDQNRSYVYRVLINGYDSEYVEIRTNGENYIVNYFVSENNPGLSATAEDFVEKPIQGDNPWKELVENVLTRIRRLNYEDQSD